jgi:hypothetical protein
MQNESCASEASERSGKNERTKHNEPGDGSSDQKHIKPK